MALTIRLFGAFEVLQDGEKIVDIPVSKEKWLLALLALEPGKRVTRAELAHTLWPFPDYSAENAIYYLRRGLMNLRKRLKGVGETCILANRAAPLWLSLDRDRVEVDVTAFEHAVRKVDDMAALEQAVMLHKRGPLLIECTEEWVVWKRQEYEVLYARALGILGADALIRRDYTKAAQWYHLRRGIEPFFEPTYQALMRVYLETEELDLAKNTYKELTTQFSYDKTWQPAEETQALFAQIEEALKRRAGRPVPPVVVGQPSANRPSLYKIPNPPTKLIGRKQESSRLQQWLVDPGVVSLTGPGGVGKSRLALSVAGEVSEDLQLATWFVNLSALSDGASLAHYLCLELAVPSETGATERALVQYLKPLPALLVLDNGEHLLAPCRHLTDVLQSACPDLRILFTSREPLHLSAERKFELSPFALPQLSRQASTPSELLEFDAIQFFTARARAIVTDFNIDADNCRYVVSICRRLDGIPLAIALAVAWIRTLSPQQISERLDHRFRLLDKGHTGELTRWQTLREMIASSYDRLSSDEQQFLRRFAVFAGGCSLETAEQFFRKMAEKPDRDVLHELSSLVDKSLIQTQIGVQGKLRFTLLESIREYCNEQLEADPDGVLAHRIHAEIYMDVAKTYCSKLEGPKHREAMTVLRAEQANFEAALQECRTDPVTGDRGLQMAVQLARYWEITGYLSLGGSLLRSLLEARPPADQALLGRALGASGVLAWRQGDLEQAQTDLKRSLEFCIGLENAAQRSDMLADLGQVSRDEGRYDEALQYFEESLAIDRARKEPARIAINLNGMGFTAYEKGDYEAARSYLEESRQIRETTVDKVGLAYVQVNLARLAQKEGDVLKAIELFEQAHFTFERYGILIEVARSYHNLGCAYEALKDFPKALEFLMEGLRRFWMSEMDRETAVALIEVAALLPPDTAQKKANLFGAARAMLEEIGKAEEDFDQNSDDDDIVALRRQLGDAFYPEWLKGLQMTKDQAVIYALEENKRHYAS